MPCHFHGYPGLSNVQTFWSCQMYPAIQHAAGISAIQPELCTRANRSSTERRKEDSSALARAAPLPPRRGVGGTPLCRPSGGWLSLGSQWGRKSPSSLPSPLLCGGGGGSMLRRNLSSLGVATPQAPLQPNTSGTTPLGSTGTAAPSIPGNNQDVGSRLSWDDLSCSLPRGSFQTSKLARTALPSGPCTLRTARCWPAHTPSSWTKSNVESWHWKLGVGEGSNGPALGDRQLEIAHGLAQSQGVEQMRSQEVVVF